MLRIKLNWFESIVVAIILPNIVFLFTTIILILSLIVEQKTIVYTGILISYVSCLVLLILSILIVFLFNKNSKKEFILYDDKFRFLQHEYWLNQISLCEYYVCRWYAIPIAFVYKQQVAGLLYIKLNTGEKIQFKIFFKDYLRLKKIINNIIEK